MYCYCVVAAVQVAACCSVRHGMPIAVDIIALAVFCVLLLVFGVVTLIALSSKKVRP